jgi:PAS domain S-box-containing protein/diguanylate cyclase (GGDEF)-like protein
MLGAYDARLVILSIVVAIFASYVALDLASRVSVSLGTRAERWWLAGGALAMGMGIWSMHFIGMLAFELPIPLAYSAPVTFLSLAFAIAVSGFALHIVSRCTLGMGRLLGAGALMGAGIALMHYTGMAAIEVAPPIRYDAALFALSIALAIAASVAALSIAFRLRSETTSAALWKKAGSAVVMGAAIAAMHYTGMAAAHFAPDSVCVVDPGGIGNAWLAGTIGAFTFVFLATALLVSVVDARLADRSMRLAARLSGANRELEAHAAELARAQAALALSEQRYRALWEASSDAIVLLSDDNRIEYANPAVREVFGHEPGSLAGRDIEILQPPRLRAVHRAAFERYLRTGEKRVDWRAVETFGLHADGHEFPVEISFSRLEFDGRSGFAGFIKDITERKRAEEQVRQTNERFRLVARATNDAVWDWDFAANTVWWNEGLESLFGFRPDEVEPGPESWTSRIHPEDLARVVEGIHAVIDSPDKSAWSDEYRFRRRDGSYADVFDRGYVMRDAAGKALRMLGAMVDITGRKQAEEKVRRLSRVHAMMSGINALIVRCRDRGELLREACRVAAEQGGFGIVVIETWSAATSTMTPTAWAGADAAPYMELVTTAPIPLAEITLGESLRERRPQFVNDIGAELATKGGNVRRRAAYKLGYQSGIALPLVVNDQIAGRMRLYGKEKNFFNEEEVRLLTELAGDISFALEHIAKEEKLNYLAYYDALTGLANRTLFHENVGHQVRLAAQQGAKVALLILDIKRFRLVNESLGRGQGDALLKALAARLKAIWPDPDNLARVASDCFAGMLPGIKDPAEVAAVLERLASEVTGPPFPVEGRELSIAMTVGVAVFPEDCDDAEELFNNAEAALKQAKSRGERYLFYQPAMNAAVAETLLLESKLRRALERDQFVLYYQPKIDLVSGRVSGLEALIRWNDPDSGLVPPGSFIHLLEETGMINEIGLWALRRALADHAAWRAAGLHAPRVAVNVSAVQLMRDDFVDVVRGAVAEVPGGASALDLEITESLLMQDIEANILKLRALRHMGVNIAIDDFGTGYSSLGYLARLPVNALKIDRSFIVTMASSDDSMAIVSTIISLAHSLSLRVIAEGVDSQEQRRLLQMLKCDEIQGYLVNRPAPRDEIARLLSGDALQA